MTTAGSLRPPTVKVSASLASGISIGQRKAPAGIRGSPHNALATVRARAALLTTIGDSWREAGSAPGRAPLPTRTVRRLTVGMLAHSPAPPAAREPEDPAGPAVRSAAALVRVPAPARPPVPPAPAGTLPQAATASPISAMTARTGAAGGRAPDRTELAIAASLPGARTLLGPWALDGPAPRYGSAAARTAPCRSQPGRSCVALTVRAAGSSRPAGLHDGPIRPRRPPRPGCSHARRLHAAQLVLEILDLISQPCGHLELQLGSGGMHLVGQLGDQRQQILASQTAALRRLAA